jgi:hypothetical protein
MLADEVSTGSSSDRVSVPPNWAVARLKTRSLPLPVLTSLRRLCYTSSNRAPGNWHDMMPQFVNLKHLRLSHAERLV